jgi:hypothetical protein
MAPTQQAFDAMLGIVKPQQRIDPAFLADTFKFATASKLWEWNGIVDQSKLSALPLYDEVLADNGEPPQTAASK